MIKPLLLYPNRLLVGDNDFVDISLEEELTTWITDLIDTVRAYNAEGLAAPQIGINKRLFVIRENDTDYTVCINPRISAVSTELTDSTEGCLSFPGVNETLKRFNSIHVEYYDSNGSLQIRELVGLPAVAFQHELDHLNKVLFIEHMGALQKRLALKKLEKVKKQALLQRNRLQAILKQRDS